MADVTDVPCASHVATLVFSGVGTIVLRPLTGGSYWLGDSGVDNTTGVSIPNAANTTLYVTSPDEVYRYNEKGRVVSSAFTTTDRA